MPLTRSHITLHVLTMFSIAALLVPSTSWGQVNKSNLIGVVRDTSGAPIPGVSIRAVNTATGAAREETSDATGLYRFTLMDSGLYRLEAQLEGFKQFVQDRVQLATGETTTIDMTLSVGALSESVQVTAETPLLRTETGALGTTVSTEVLNDLPLIGRNPYVFLTLAPGIQYTGSPGALNPWDVFGPADFAASGSEARSEFLLDGIPNMRLDVVSFSPSPDAVQEMRVQARSASRRLRCHNCCGLCRITSALRKQSCRQGRPATIHCSSS